MNLTILTRKILAEERRKPRLAEFLKRALPVLSLCRMCPGYDLLEEIGRGGMGVVYRGRHRKLDREVAIKTIPLTGRQAGRSEREILAAGRLQHPNIVQTHDAGETDSVAWIVMELLNGDHLGQLIESSTSANREALSFTTVVDYIRQAAEGLQEVHDAGLVHRDVKPPNLMVTADGQVKLLDLGLVTCGGDAVDAVDGSITDETTIMGSFDYIAPEQGRDAMSADHRADIYGLGCSLFALLTGRPPFSSDQFRNASQKLIAHACEPRPNARDFNPDVPEELAKLAQGMMSIEPAERPQSAREVASVLVQFCGGDSGTTHRKWTAAAAFGGLILALGVIITIKLNSGRTIRVESDEPVTSIRMENTESGDVTSISIESSQSATTGRQPSRRSVEEQRDGEAKLDIESLSAKYSHHLRTVQHSTLSGFCFGPNNDEIFTSGEDGRILRWSFASTAPEEILQTDGLPITRALTVTNDGSAIIYSTKGVLWKWNRDTRKHDWQFKTAAVAARTLSDSDYFVGLQSAHADVTQIRSVDSGEVIRQTVTNRVRVIPDIARDLEHVLCASPASDNVVFKTIAAKSKVKKYRAFEANDFTPRYAAFDRTEQKIIALDGDGTTVVWNRSPMEILRRKKDADLSRTHLIPLCESEQFLSVEGLTQLVIWNPIDGSVHRKIDVRPVRAIEVSTNGRMALTADRAEGLVHLWDLTGGSSVSATTATHPTAAVATTAVAGLPTEPLTSTEGLPQPAGGVDDGGDLRSGKSAGSGDPRTAKSAGSGDPRTAGSGDPSTAKGDLGGAAAWPDDAPAVAKLPFDPEAALRHQRDWAEYVRLPVVQENSLGMPMRLIPPGEFEMGMKEEQVQTLLDRWEESTGKSFAGTGASWWKMAQRHRVELSNPMLVAQHEVTFQNYQALTGEDLRKSVRPIDSYPTASHEIASCPVRVSWIAAVRFCNALSVSEGLDSYYEIADDDAVRINGGDGYRLLTEAEWEFACRSGSDEMFWTDGVHKNLAHYAVITTSKPQPDFVQPAVGTRAPNGFGLQDMLSIPQDWCYDWYDIDWYEKSPAVNPIGPRLNRSHCIRGASRYSLPFRVGSAFRAWGGQFPHAKINAIRLCRTITAAVAGLPTEPLTSAEGLPKPASNTNGGGDLRSAKSAGSGDPRTAGAVKWPVDAPAAALLPFDSAKAVEHQQAWAKYLSRQVETQTEHAGIMLRLIPPGEFLMGATEDEVDELVAETRSMLGTRYKDRREQTLRAALPRHPVRVSEPFLMSACEVTIDQFCAVTGKSRNEAARWLERTDVERIEDSSDAQYPAHVKWVDAVRFCNGLSRAEGLPEYYKVDDDANVEIIDSEGFRLPTEAEWEFACRSGSYARIWTDGTHRKFRDYAAYRGEADRELAEAKPVAQKLPNAFGLYDMFGNMSEWCFDYYDAGYYANAPANNPRGPKTGLLRCRRGRDAFVFNVGAWIRSYGQSPDSAGGIRVVRTVRPEDAD